MIVRAKTRRGEDWDKVASSLSSPLSFFLILFFLLAFLSRLLTLTNQRKLRELKEVF